MPFLGKHLTFSWALCASVVFTTYFYPQPTLGQRLLYVLNDPEPDFGFGGVVSPIGDVDGDGVNDIAVASPYKDTNGTIGQGQVSVFSGAQGTWLHTINDPRSPFMNAHFGSAIAGLGDIDGDGLSDYAVGAHGSSTGDVFVFSGSQGAFLYSVKSPSGSLANDFGRSIAAVADLDGDAVSDFIVGDEEDRNPYSNSPNQPQGKAFVFSGANGALIRTLENPDPDADTFQLFGAANSGLGDANGDNVPDIAIGAWQQRVGEIAEGRAFLYSGIDGVLLHELDVPVDPDQTWREGNAGVGFGRRIAGIGDVDGDLAGDVIVSSPGEREGKAYVFSGASGSLLYAVEHPAPQPTTIGFSRSVGAVGDVNRDSVPDFAVSDWLSDEGRGQAFIFSGIDGDLLLTLDDPQPQAFSRFGTLSLVPLGDLDGDLIPEIAIGASHRGVGENASQGQVFVFSLVPEPSGIAMLLLGAGMLLHCRSAFLR